MQDCEAGLTEYHKHHGHKHERKGHNHRHHAHIDDDTFLCCPFPDGADFADVIAAYRLQRLRDLSGKNFNLAVLCLIYTGVNCVCIIMNSLQGEFMDAHEHTFHLIEFWATFAFSCVQIYSLIWSPRSLGSVYSNPLVLKMVMFFNVVATFMSALLVSVSLEDFEAPSHELEYSNEITMAFVDVVFLSVVAKQVGYGAQGVGFTLVAAVVSMAVAIAQLAIYNVLNGPSGGAGEQIAHYFEFGFGIISALISFSFCMDNKFLCDEQLRQLLTGPQGKRCTNGARGA